MSFSPALMLYDAATRVVGPFAGLWLDQRARNGKEDAARLGERYGRYTRTRPSGKLVWLHAASVGESGVALALIEALRAREDTLSFLLSTGTRTSADLVAQRAPTRTTHVYAPIDRRDAVRRFLTHWRPDLAVFVESELWPNLILETEQAGVPLVLANARMSPRSLRRWETWRAAGEKLTRAFTWISAADQRTAQTLTRLRGGEVKALGNLKLAIAPPRVDAAARGALANETKGRRVWLAASTHPGEDEIVLAAHALLRAQSPEALLIVAPRHPERGAAVAALAGGAPRRSRFEPIGQAPVYVADTLGELGLFYDLSPAALVSGSLLPDLKGHNPVEPAKLGCAIITGPFVESFQDTFDALAAVGGAVIAPDAQSLAAAVSRLWRDAAARDAQVEAARSVINQGAAAMEVTVAQLAVILNKHTTAEHAHASA